jgi:predicted AAA+ superfamily ATPase
MIDFQRQWRYNSTMNNKVNRIIGLNALLKTRSVFLLGPRQTGKSWLIREQFPNALKFNLLQSEVFLSLSSNPSKLREVTQPSQLVVIDEIQRIPELLNEVHYLIEERQSKFLLTGSSARKLRKKGVNLLGGRASTVIFHPLSSIELQEDFNLERALNVGLLPAAYLNADPTERLSSYVDDYLQQEILAEGASRNLPAFSRFLTTAAQCNAQLINFSNIANDAQVSPTTVREYFSLLEDTLIARRLEPWRSSRKRKAINTAKFYFFDTGVVRHLQSRPVYTEGTTEYGHALETYLHHELRCFCDYHSREPLTFWRSATGIEVDFLIGDRLAIELKASRQVSDRMLNGLRALREEGIVKHFVMLSFEPFARVVDGIELVPFSDFVRRLWNGDWEFKLRSV